MKAEHAKMVKFCTVNKFGIPFAYYECMCNDCNWMGEFNHLKLDFWDHYRYCPKCGSDDLDEFDAGVYEEYIHLKTEWGGHEKVDPIFKLIWKMIWRRGKK